MLYFTVYLQFWQHINLNQHLSLKLIITWCFKKNVFLEINSLDWNNVIPWIKHISLEKKEKQEIINVVSVTNWLYHMFYFRTAFPFYRDALFAQEDALTPWLIGEHTDSHNGWILTRQEHMGHCQTNRYDTGTIIIHVKVCMHVCKFCICT